MVPPPLPLPTAPPSTGTPVRRNVQLDHGDNAAPPNGTAASTGAAPNDAAPPNGTAAPDATVPNDTTSQNGTAASTGAAPNDAASPNGTATSTGTRPSDATPALTGTEASEIAAAATGALEPEKRKSRAGRNLPAAIGVGAGLGGLVVVSLFVWKTLFLFLVIAAVTIGVWEMVRAVSVQKARPPLVPLLLGAPLMVCLAWFGGAERLPLGLVATLLLVFVWRFADGVPHYQRDVTAGALIAVYVPFLGSFAALLAYPAHDGAVRVLVTILAVVLSDTGGYATGVFLGKHPMAPSVSPAKSWEGFAGSIFWTGAGSAVALPLLLDDAIWWHGAIFGVAVSIASVLGDLGESLIKRDLGVKDMSNLLPGHGGLMDRLDSVLLALPTAYAVLAFLVPWTR
ncbi:phosphatidate cytidylyltransferase [Dactylosporangium sp. CS-033363]|uniref:phosphatidate cytidylyltransferase n=1 Tax=Dactylosporangium sp. CS-033363 TaxID=3239935 RepID=UPI003D902760